MISRRFVPWTAFVAVFALFFAQVLVASHEIEHLGQLDDGSCEICLAANAIGSPLTSSQPTLPFLPAPAPLARAPGYKPPSERYFRVHHARAPPTPVRS